MIARDFLSKKLLPLKPNYTCAEALDILNEYAVAYLPVVKDNKHLGYICVSDICGELLKKDKILKYIVLTAAPVVHQDQHFFEIIKLFSSISSTVVSVIDNNDFFVGILSAKELINNLAQFNAYTQMGSVIMLELDLRNYSLAEISQIIESNQAKIWSIYTYSVPDTNLIQVHIKLNTNNIKSILATFNRYNYQVVASFFREDDYGDMMSRYQLLMKYIEP